MISTTNSLHVALKTALEKLNYNPYHMAVAIRSRREGHLSYWEEALRAKFLGDGKPFGKEEFDKFLGNYDVRPFAFPTAVLLALLH